MFPNFLISQIINKLYTWERWVIVNSELCKFDWMATTPEGELGDNFLVSQACTQRYTRISYIDI